MVKIKKYFLLLWVCILQTGFIFTADAHLVDANLTDTLILDEARRFSGDFAQVVHEGKHKQLHRSGLLVDDKGDQHQNGNSIVRNGNGYGVINYEGKLIVPFSYDDIRFDGSHIRLRTEDKDGLVDSIGNLVIPVEHDEVTPLTEQVVRVRKGHLWALMDIATRKRLTDYVYTNIIYDPNPEHLISVEISDKWGLVDEQGTVRIKADYARIFPHTFPSNDVIWYCQTEGLGMSIVDSNGKILTDGYYEHIRPAGPDKWTAIGERGRTFSLLDLKSREVKASHTGSLYSFIDSVAVVDQDGKSGVIGLDGRVIIPFTYDRLGYVYDRYPADYGQTSELATRFTHPFSFKEPLSAGDSASVTVSPAIRYVVAAKGNEVHVFYPNGQLHAVIDHPVVGHMVFNGQFMLLVGEQDRFGLSDLSGKLIVPILYSDMVLTSAIFYKKGMPPPHAVYAEYLNVMMGDSVGVYHVSGRKVTDAKWKNVMWESDRFFSVLDAQGRTALINLEGETVFPAADEVQYHFVANSRMVKTSRDVQGNESSVLLDEAGKELYANPKWNYHAREERQTRFAHGFLKLAGKALNGLFIDSLGKEYLFNSYDYVGSFTHGVALVVQEGKAGFIALDGKEIIPLFLKIEKEQLVEAGTDAYTTGMVFEYMLTRMVNDDPLIALGNIDGTKSLFSFKSDAVARLFTYDQITHASYNHRDRYYTVKSEGRMGLHRADGELIYPADYDGIRVFVHEHSVELQKDGKYGLGSIDGTITLPVMYEAIERNSGSAPQPFFPVAVSEKGKWSFINEQGEKLPVIVKEFGR